MLVIQSILLSFGIDALGYLKSIVNRYVYSYETSDSEEEIMFEIKSQKTCECTLDEFGLRFWPPVYVQRYMAVQEILEHTIWNGSIKKVVDFGCAEFGLFKCIKLIRGLSNIMLVDVDFNTLDNNQSKVLPTNNDYLSVGQRTERLIVDIFNGSIAELDDRMLGIDAVICIELIEHLYLDVLDAVPRTVFEFIKPKLAIFTTPNVEFNVLFPNFTTEFRHDDHKFEWTRKQFKEWAKKITTRYPEYAVQFVGIGAGPAGTENLGCCSQMAIFYRKDMETSPVKPVGFTPYKLLRRVNYPFELDYENTIRDQTVYDILKKVVLEASSNKEYIVGDSMEIPLNIIMPYVTDFCSSIEELENFVSKLYQTKKNDLGEWILIRITSELSSGESDSNSLSNHSGQEYSLLEDIDNENNDGENWNSSMGLSFGQSKLCYSTPMTQNQQLDVLLNHVGGPNTAFSTSDLYKTDYSKRGCVDMDDMEVSSSCNNSITIDDCKVYKDFVTGRYNSAIDDEDTSETEKTLMFVTNGKEFSNASDVAKDNINNDSNEEENWISSMGMNFGESKLCYSAPMFKNQQLDVFLNHVDHSNTEFSTSDLYKTAVDYSKREGGGMDDMEVSSSCNSSIIIDDCKVYKDFVIGRCNSAIDEEDINETKKKLTFVTNDKEFSNTSDVAKDNVTKDNNEKENWNSSMGMNFGESKLCYSTPMIKNQQLDVFLNHVDSSNTTFSASDLYKTAVDYSKREGVDMDDVEVSSSCNSSIVIDDCYVYKDFVRGRSNSAVVEEDISVTEKSVTFVMDGKEFSNTSDVAKNEVTNDNTVIQNSSNISLKHNCSSDTAHEFQSINCDNFSNNVINEGDHSIDNQSSVFLNRTLLDESGYTENLLSIPDKES